MTLIFPFLTPNVFFARFKHSAVSLPMTSPAMTSGKTGRRDARVARTDFARCLFEGHFLNREGKGGEITEFFDAAHVFGHGLVSVFQRFVARDAAEGSVQPIEAGSRSSPR